ncbi:MAG TPA: winged helix-turn-helix domain-containing protein [Rhizomicrobium sp.]|nr:winged helix-turn-helix domain-containing protein [Rhizomicrobium sp.]
MIEQGNPVYRFGDFELQPEERRLLQAGEAIPLTPKVFEILHLLVGRAGHAVSKDEIMATIWPGRFVAESNLTKHIWTLRQALGEGDEGGRFIETLPKLGYRFLAPVCREAELTLAQPRAEPNQFRVTTFPDAATDFSWQRRRAFRAGAATASFLVIAALAVGWLWNAREPVFPWSHRAPGTAVAVFDFDNLSRDGKQAWIGTAFSEMLGVEMAQGGQLHLLPAELIHAVRGRPPERGAGGFSPSTLAELRRQLAVDYVVTGGYFASDKNDSAVRLDLALQDARSGATVATFTHTGSADDLPSLASKASADLRRDMNIPPQSLEERRLVANARPPSTDVMRHIGFGLDALHRYDAARARDELLQAVADAPDYAPSYVYLAKAWSQLGYDQKAQAAAKQAADRAASLPQAMRLKIEAQSYRAESDWAKAAVALRKSAALQPDDFETQLDLAKVLLSAGKAQEAGETIQSLRSLGRAVAGDPRLELADADIAAAQGDPKARTGHARRALELATARGAAGLKADAELALGEALMQSDPRTANATLGQALVDYRHIGNPRGEAATHRLLGILFENSQPQRGREEYRKSLTESQAIGDRNGMAAAYADLGTVLWFDGDKDGAETATRNVLRLRRETGDIAGQAWALAALAVEQSDERAGEETIAGFREAAALDASIGAHSHRGFSLFSLADILRLRGELAQAQVVCAEALSEYARMGDSASGADAHLECAQISLDRGEVSAAGKELGTVRDLGERTNRPMMLLGNLDVAQGQIAMGEGEWAKAAGLIEKAKQEYARSDLKTGEAVAASLLALCYSALGKMVDRDAAVRRAAELRSGMTERQEILQVDVALNELRGETGRSREAISQLESIAADARQRSWPGWALEAELAEFRVLRKTGQTSHAIALKKHIEEEARRQGFGWILRRAIRA